MNRVTVPTLTVALLLAGTVSAQHWTPPQPTGIDHSIVITAADVDGVPLVHPDEVAVFTSVGTLAGVGVWPESGSLGLAAWGDDPLTTDTVEGFTTGESFRFRVWVSVSNTEYAAEATLVSGQPTFHGDGMTVFTLVAHEMSVDQGFAPLPSKLGLAAWPNPFNPAVTVSFSRNDGMWGVRVTDLAGRVVRHLDAEGRTVVWDGRAADGSSVASGVYLVRGVGSAEGLNLRLVKVE